MATKSARSSGTQLNQRGITQGNTLVDPKTGYPVNVKQDDEGNYRLCVDAAITLDSANVSVDLDPIGDEVHIGDATTGNTLLVNPDGTIGVNTEVDASDGNNIAISAHPSPNQIFDEAADTLTTASFEEILSEIPQVTKCSYTTGTGNLCKFDARNLSPSGYCKMHVLQDPKLEELGVKVPKAMTKAERKKFCKTLYGKLEKLKKRGAF